VGGPGCSTRGETSLQQQLLLQGSIGLGGQQLNSGACPCCRRANAFEASQGRASAAAAPPSSLSCRLLLDCMGHYSPIVKQIRGRAKPEGICLVVGCRRWAAAPAPASAPAPAAALLQQQPSRPGCNAAPSAHHARPEARPERRRCRCVLQVGGCAEGLPAELNTSADLLYTMTDATDGLQLYWEAFPAGGRRRRWGHARSRRAAVGCHARWRPAAGPRRRRQLQLRPRAGQPRCYPLGGRRRCRRGPGWQGAQLRSVRGPAADPCC
jgi:hypothetical protein